VEKFSTTDSVPPRSWLFLDFLVYDSVLVRLQLSSRVQGNEGCAIEYEFLRGCVLSCFTLIVVAQFVLPWITSPILMPFVPFLQAHGAM
jgi:hypothetical protein